MKFTFTTALLAILLSTGGSPEAMRLVVFEGSDWCAECRQLERNVLSDSTFSSFLETEGIEIVRADFPQRKKLDKSQVRRNEALAEQFGFAGQFPTLILSATDTFYTISYQRESTQELITLLQKYLQ